MNKIVRFGIALAFPFSLGGVALADNNNPNDNNANNPDDDNTPGMQIRHGAKALESSAKTGILNRTLSATDKKFLDDAAQINMAEARIGQLAIDMGKSDQVKDYGRKLMTDHQAALMKEKDLATRVGYDLPTDVTAAQKSDADKLAKLSSDDFDHQFLTHMRDGHAKAITIFQKEVRDGTNPLVKDYATQILPTLKLHLGTAKTDLHRMPM